ncbi:MAG: type VI secretion system baseplate subunit TssG [Phycisphaerales bacterium]
MAGADRASTDALARDALIARLLKEPFAFDFFMALRRVENARAPLPRIGHSRRLADDPIRLGQEPSLAFAPAAFSKTIQSGSLPRLLVTFFGVFGPNGPLPHHLTEYARERERLFSDQTFSRFADIFHHRLLSLFYRAWAVNNKAVQYERAGAAVIRERSPAAPASPSRAAGEDDAATVGLGDEDAPDLSADRFFMYIASLFGLGMPSLHRRDRVPDIAKAHYSGRLVAQNRGAEGLAAVVSDYFGVPCRVDQFVGQWMRLPADCRLRLGESPETGRLGSSAIVGSSIWEAQQKFRLVVGPVSLNDYQRMLPGGDSLSRLTDWISLYSGAELSWDMNLILKRAQVPAIQLGRFGQLGWTTWTRSRPHPRDADDLVLTPPAA